MDTSAKQKFEQAQIRLLAENGKLSERTVCRPGPEGGTWMRWLAGPEHIAGTDDWERLYFGVAEDLLEAGSGGPWSAVLAVVEAQAQVCELVTGNQDEVVMVAVVPTEQVGVVERAWLAGVTPAPARVDG